MKGSGNSAFLQKGQLCWLKQQKNQLSAFIFHRTTCKIVTFFVNASQLGEKLKKGRYFELSSENILTSILPAFYPFLTLPNKALKCEKGTFFAVTSNRLKSAKKVPFLRLEKFL